MKVFIQVGKHKIKRNTLIYYSGGGYSGCINEPNFAYINDDLEYISLYHSGVGGCDTLEKFINYIEDDYSSYDFYEIDEYKEVERSNKEFAASAIAGITKKVDEFYAICNNCKCEIHDYDEIRLEGLHGVGGIASEYSDLLCYECHDSGSCEECHEYYGEEELKKIEVEDGEDRKYVCEYCFEEKYAKKCKECSQYQDSENENTTLNDYGYCEMCWKNIVKEYNDAGNMGIPKEKDIEFMSRCGEKQTATILV